MVVRRRWSDGDVGRTSVSQKDLDTPILIHTSPRPFKLDNHISDVNRTVQEPEECVICLDELWPGRAIFKAECGHQFHFTCLLENVNHDEANSDKCPVCRKPQKEWPEQTDGLVKAHPFCMY